MPTGVGQVAMILKKEGRKVLMTDGGFMPMKKIFSKEDLAFKIPKKIQHGIASWITASELGKGEPGVRASNIKKNKK